jgi:hypothetical protein
MEIKEQKIRPQNRKKNLKYYKERFSTLLEEKNDCLLFTGSLSKKGYGHFHNHNEVIAHRFSWFINNGTIPDGLHVLHHCDVRNCVKISHLWLGTDKDNSDDKIRKNRDRKLTGDDHPSSKISEEQAGTIARMLSEGKTPTEISIELGISRHIIFHIKNKRIRKDLQFSIPLKIIKTKNCIQCGKEYRPKPFKFKNSKYCCTKCRHLYQDGKTREQLKSNRKQ